MNEDLEVLGNGDGEVLQGSKIEEIMLPNTLKQVSRCAFKGCDNLRAIHVTDSCKADLSQLDASSFAKLSPRAETMTDLVQRLRGLQNVVVPEGTERIGSYWFLGCGAESVVIPASVREIGANAFCNCKRLKHVRFQDGSRLEEIGAGCFAGSGLERITIQKTVRQIGKGAFSCPSLKCVYVKDGCQADVRSVVGERIKVLYEMRVPDGTKTIAKDQTRLRDVYRVIVPNSVEEIQEGAF